MKKHKPNTLLLISSIIGNIYAGILLWDLINNLTTAENSLYGLGQILGTMITAPQVILTIIGVIFSWIGVSSGMSRNALVAGILYSVSVVFRITELLFILPQWKSINYKRLTIPFSKAFRQLALNQAI